MAEWNDCIVSFIDMINVRSLLGRNSTEAVALMRRMHEAIRNAERDLSAHAELCFWNDSVLLMGLVNKSRSSYRALMKEVLSVKGVVDNINWSYAICVKGKAFPLPPSQRRFPKRHEGDLNLICLQASSLAFANCFEIDHKAKKEKWNWEWYIDNRIKEKIRPRDADNIEEVNLFPGSRIRKIHMYNGSFWAQPNVQC
jgi:hypothetical protein